MQSGARHGVWTQLMKPVVEKLTNDDIVAIVAYTASRPVGAEKNGEKKEITSTRR
jgi:cytochrome c553